MDKKTKKKQTMFELLLKLNPNRLFNHVWFVNSYCGSDRQQINNPTSAFAHMPMLSNYFGAHLLRVSVLKVRFRSFSVRISPKKVCVVPSLLSLTPELTFKGTVTVSALSHLSSSFKTGRFDALVKAEDLRVALEPHVGPP